MDFRVAYLQLNLPYCKGQGYAHFRPNIVDIVIDMVHITTAIKIASHASPLDWHIYIWPWRILTVKIKIMHILDCEYIFEMVIKVTTALK